MATSISAVVGDLPCFPTFYVYDFKFIIPYTCLFTFCNIIVTGELMHTEHTESKERMAPELMFCLNAHPNMEKPLHFTFNYVQHVLQMKDSRRSASAINPATMKYMDNSRA